MAVPLALAACTVDWPGPGDALFTANPPTAGPIRGEQSASGFVVDGDGRVVTAGHAVEGCDAVYVSRGNRLLAAKVVAKSSAPDLALLAPGVPLAPRAVFIAADEPVRNGTVFVASYQALPSVLAEGGGLFNAVGLPPEGRPGEIALVSDAGHGTSGAPVFDGNGLVIGVVARRTAMDRVLAIAAGTVRTFLAAQGIVAATDDHPQLGTFQDRASPAATLTVGVRCFRR